MIYKTHGIIIHKLNYSENSQILKILTRSHGLVSFFQNGVRSKSKGRKVPLHPLAQVELVMKYQETKSLHQIRELKLLHPLNSIQLDSIKTSLVIFIAEVLLKTLKEEEQDGLLFDFINEAIIHLENAHDNVSNFHLVFLLHFSKHLGFYPHTEYKSGQVFDLNEGLFTYNSSSNHETMNSELSSRLHEMLSLKFDTYPMYNLPNTLRKQVLHSLLSFYKIHTNTIGTIKSHHVLAEVLE